MLLVSSALGCAAQLQARGGTGGATVSARVQGDARATAAAGILAAGVAALAAGGSDDSQPAAPGAVHTSSPRIEASAGLAVQVRSVALIDDATGATVRRVEGGALRVTGAESALGGASVTGGSLRVRVAVGGEWTVTGGSLVASTGRTVQVGAGSLRVEDRAGGACVVTEGVVALASPGPAPVAASVAPAVRVGATVDASLERVLIATGPDVLGGGTVRIEGAPDLADLRVVDGRVELRVTAGADVNARAAAGVEGRWELRGGVVLLEDGRGRRWRCRVEGGAVVATTDGANPQGVAVWTPSAATLRVSVTVQGDLRLALTGDSPAVPLMTSPVALPQRVMAALDALICAAPQGSVEAMRLASAVQVAIRQAESADPALYAVPVRGRSVVLLLDVSYSMRDVDPASIWFDLGRDARPTKLDVARAELVKVLASLPAGTTANVIAFSSDARALWTAPATLDAAHLDEAIRWLVGLRPADETRPGAAIELAASMRPEQMVVISDGRPSDADVEGRSLLGFVQGISVRTRVDVVGVGPDQDREFLAALALNGRGSLRQR